MDYDQVVSQTKQQLNTALAHFQEELKKVRTGRAQSGMLDGVSIEAYGVAMPLNQVATVTAPEPQLLQITPFDPTNLQAIASAIRDNQSLGFNPMDDGRVVRVAVPALTEERRHEIVKQLGAKTEECMISLRNIRHENFAKIDRAKKAKEIGEDAANRYEKQIDEAVNTTRSEAEVAAKAKEQDVLSL